MRAAKQFNAKFVEGLKPVAGKQVDYWDPAYPGFGVRVSPRGKKAWIFMYRAHGKKRRMTLGAVGSVKLMDARQAASNAADAVEKGLDPAAEKIEQRRTRPQSFEELANEFLERHARPHKRTADEDEKTLKRHVLPTWQHRRVDSIRRADVIRLIEGVHKKAPIASNRLLALLKTIFNWGMKMDLVDDNPTHRVKPLAKERSRDRILSDDELAAVLTAARKMEWPWNGFFSLLILTAQRRDEVAGMGWPEIDLANKVWRLEATRTKSDRGHEVPLSRPARFVLNHLPAYHSALVFPARANPEAKTYVSGYGKAKDELDRLSGVTDWKIHDLRRTAASGMARLGVAPHVVEKILNHTSGQISGVAAVYNRYGYDGEKRRALDAWARHLLEIQRKAKRRIAG